MLGSPPIHLGAAILKAMGGGTRKIRRRYRAGRWCAAWLSLIAVLLVTVPSAVSQCCTRVSAARSEPHCGCCIAANSIQGASKTCCYAHSQPGLPAVPIAVPSSAQIVSALIDVSTTPAFDLLLVYRSARPMPPPIPPLLLHPILRI